MNRNGIPTPLDLGPDPEPLSSERYEALMNAARRAPRATRQRRFAPHPMAVVPAEWRARTSDDAPLTPHR